MGRNLHFRGLTLRVVIQNTPYPPPPATDVLTGERGSGPCADPARSMAALNALESEAVLRRE